MELTEVRYNGVVHRGEAQHGEWLRLSGVHRPVHYTDVVAVAKKATKGTTAERDPNGLDIHAPGAKADAGKPRPLLIFRDMARALNAVIKIATDGAVKYSPGGWLQVANASERYDDADLRHMLKRYIDGPIDSDSKSLHLAHEAWNALAKLELHLRAEEAAGK